jgi:hypothetical protein
MDDSNDLSETTDAVASEERTEGAASEDPAVLGRYRVIQSLGEGSFGRV